MFKKNHNPLKKPLRKQYERREISEMFENITPFLVRHKILKNKEDLKEVLNAASIPSKIKLIENQIIAESFIFSEEES